MFYTVFNEMVVRPVDERYGIMSIGEDWGKQNLPSQLFWPCGGIGIRCGLKIRCLRTCGFEPHQGYIRKKYAAFYEKGGREHMAAIFVLLIPLFILTGLFEGVSAIPEKWREHKEMAIFRKTRRIY